MSDPERDVAGVRSPRDREHDQSRSVEVNAGLHGHVVKFLMYFNRSLTCLAGDNLFLCCCFVYFTLLLLSLLSYFC